MQFFTIVSSLIKYIFITIIYLFIFGIIKMVYQDIRRALPPAEHSGIPKKTAYLKLDGTSSQLSYDVRDYYTLDKDEVIIGRGKDCGIYLNDLYLSTHNTRLWYENNEWLIEDLSSTNGTFVNDVPLGETPMILDNGDKIRVGQAVFIAVI